LALLVVPAAAAKGIGTMVVVGADGRADGIAGGDRLMRAGRAAAIPKNSGYLLVYPMLRSGAPAGTGRYYPAKRVVCFSIFRVSRSLPCYVADPFLVAQLRRAPSLPRFTRPPTRLVRLARNGVVHPLQPVAAPTFELALAWWRSAVRAPELGPCTLSFLATWSGPEADSRPRTICLTSVGLVADGRAYPISASAYNVLAASG